MRPDLSGTSTPEDMVTQYVTRLRDHGYAIIPDVMTPLAVQTLDRDLSDAFAQTPFCEGGFYGARTRRFGRLLTRAPRSAAFVAHPLILAICEAVLGPWCDTLQLNLTQGLALHPGALPQLPHRDEGMWEGEKGRMEYLVNVMWPFTDYTAENGATLIWPDSHGANVHDGNPDGAPIVAEMPPGSALLFLGSTLHGAGGNRSASVRRGMIVSYCLGWLKPYENQWLAYPPDVARHFPRELAGLVGYRQHRPNLGNFEGQCPSILLDGPASGPIGAIDALRPDQAEAVAAFVAGQR